MKRARVLFLLLFLLPTVLIGCTRMKIITLSEPVVPELLDWKQVQVYDDIEQVTGSFQEMAVIEVKSAPTWRKMIRDSRRKAAAMGANGIVVQRTGKHDETLPVFVAGVIIMTDSEYWDGRVLAIRVE